MKREMNSKEALVLLNLIPGLGPAGICRLMDAFGKPEDVFRAGPVALRAVLGAPAQEPVVNGILTAEGGPALLEELRLAKEEGVRIVTVFDADYPGLLRTAPYSPPVLYVKGTIVPEDGAAVALVGTRSATPYGLSVAKSFSHELTRCGITVVSGLAEGIDAAGHEAALQSGGRTIAVVGHGLTHIYPAVHRKLAERIAGSGALVSEFPMKMPPLKTNFPRRNRTIAGLSFGVVVVEAPLKSGALITAREALDLNREVFAVPGPIQSPQSRGCHRLIKEGAKLAEDVRDLLEELAPRLRERLDEWKQSPAEEGPVNRLPPEFFQKLTAEEQVVYGAVPAGKSMMVDTLAGVTTMPPAKLLPLLTGLELKGLIVQRPGQGFSRG